ncbi:MAG: hypothetical protein ACYCZR_01695 [Burkholderiales bacterium]
MTVRVLKSTDTNAPVLTGQAGSLIALLDAVLVNGFGASSPLGWTMPFTGTGKRAYRNSGGTGCHLRVQDDQSSYGRAYVQGYKAMTSIDAGSDGFVQNATGGNYAVWGKSATLDATPRSWIAVGCEQAFHLAVQHGEFASDFAHYFFGDIESLDQSDPDRSLIVCRAYASPGYIGSLNYTYDQSADMEPYAGYVGSGKGKWMPKNYGATGPAEVGTHSIHPFMTSTPGSAFYAGSVSMLPYPYMGTKIVIAPVFVHQGTTSPRIVRGRIPGLWVPAHSRPLGNLDTYSGVSGKSFIAINVYNSGQLHLETSDPWS